VYRSAELSAFEGSCAALPYELLSTTPSLFWPFLESSAVDVGAHVVQLFGLLLQREVHQVAHGEKADDAAFPRYRKMTAIMDAHDFHGFLHGGRSIDGEDVCRHDFAHRGRIRIAAAHYHPDQK